VRRKSRSWSGAGVPKGSSSVLSSLHLYLWSFPKNTSSCQKDEYYENTLTPLFLHSQSFSKEYQSVQSTDKVIMEKLGFSTLVIGIGNMKSGSNFMSLHVHKLARIPCKISLANDKVVW
jgi:hypothetical protein